MFEALEKVKAGKNTWILTSCSLPCAMTTEFWFLIGLGVLIIAELMVLGFISLILTFSQYYIAKICIPIKTADTMLPCAAKHEAASGEEENRRRLLWYEHRFLAGAPTTKSSCKKEVFLFIYPCLPYSNGAS